MHRQPKHKHKRHQIEHKQIRAENKLLVLDLPASFLLALQIGKLLDAHPIIQITIRPRNNSFDIAYPIEHISVASPVRVVLLHRLNLSRLLHRGKHP
jgi:hypothetical protein